MSRNNGAKDSTSGSAIGRSASASWSLIVAVKEEDVLQNTLLRSPDIDDRFQIILKRGYPSAAAAYNEGLSEATGDLCIFVHTDVYFPKRWFDVLEENCDKLNRVDPNWGVLGVCGCSSEGKVAGHIYSTGLGQIVGRRFEGAIGALSLDEMLLVTRRSASLRFDQELPGFHLYGTDICLEAEKRGMKSYIISAFCIHNSNGIRVLPWAFWKAYLYLRRKWWDRLPVRSCCTTITKGYGNLAAGLRTAVRQKLLPTRVGARCGDPEQLFRELQADPSLSGAQ